MFRIQCRSVFRDVQLRLRSGFPRGHEIDVILAFPLLEFMTLVANLMSALLQPIDCILAITLPPAARQVQPPTDVSCNVLLADA